MDKQEPDLGRLVVRKDEPDKGAFKTPTVRNVALTAPYMHDGSQKTLEEVVDWYDKGGHPNPHLSDKTEEARPDGAGKGGSSRVYEVAHWPFPADADRAAATMTNSSK